MNDLNIPGVIYHFCRKKSLKWLDLNALKFFATNNFFQNDLRYIELDTLGVSSQNILGNLAVSGTRIKTMT